MNSIKIRLIVLFTLVSTLMLGAFGIYANMRLSKELETRFNQIKDGAVTRLKVNLPTALWNYDKPVINSIIEAEMLPQEVRGVFVLSDSGEIFAGFARDEEGKPIATNDLAKANGISVIEDIPSPSKVASGRPNDTQGKVNIFFSREQIEASLRRESLYRVGEVLAVDLLLIVVLTLSLRMVFGPLMKLRDALFELASHDQEYVEELPDTQPTEFSEVITGFNMTLRKLRAIIVRTRKAEEETRAGAVKTEEAYAKLRSAQDSLVQAEKMASLGGLVAGVAHEINTPIGIAMTTASVLFEETDRLNKSIALGGLKKSEVTTYAATATESALLIMNNTNRAAQLIQSFKQVAVDQTSEQRRQYDLKDYIEEVMASLHSRLKANRVKVTIVCPVSINLDGYPGTMAQVITNLTMNALTHAFGEREGDNTIEIAAVMKDNQVNMTFNDNGCGIAPAHIGKVFDPFFTTRRGTGGTGLGLNIVYNILSKQFGGTITVQSEVGKGSCFILRFPRVSPLADADNSVVSE